MDSQSGAQRKRLEAFNTLEKRRLEFVDAVHEQLLKRSKLSAVLAHLDQPAMDGKNPAENISA
ncbi:hypothetical protein [Bradyrhizobium sp. AZCC 2230]|uniref:hypothetical protein n=1 Tax=Bradyrhizobium sp. AZCC 2230 TaxID=3117021 RepID=UPI002FF1FFA1